MDDVRERGGRRRAALCVVHVEAAVVRRVGAAVRAAAAVVDRQRERAGLVDDVRRVVADELRVVLAVRVAQSRVVAVALDGADERVRQRCTERTPVHRGHERQRRSEGDRHEQHDSDPFDGRLASFHGAMLTPGA